MSRSIFKEVVVRGGAFSNNRVRSDKALFPWENGSLINEKYFRGVEDFSSGDYRSDDYCGIMPVGFALSTVYAWGEENCVNGMGLLNGEMPHHDNWDSYVDPYEIDISWENDDWEGYYNPDWLPERQYCVSIENDAWALLQKLGFDPERLDDSDPLLDSMLYVAKLFNKSGIVAVVNLFEGNVEEDRDHHRLQNCFIIRFCEKLKTAKRLVMGGREIPCYNIKLPTKKINRIKSAKSEVYTHLAEAIWG